MRIQIIKILKQKLITLKCMRENQAAHQSICISLLVPSESYFRTGYETLETKLPDSHDPPNARSRHSAVHQEAEASLLITTWT